jgi:hypothetical protein
MMASDYTASPKCANPRFPVNKYGPLLMNFEEFRMDTACRFPELASEILESQSAMEIWIHLRLLFEDAYASRPVLKRTIKRIYDFAHMCRHSERDEHPGYDLCTCANVAFFEHLPEIAPARRELAQWLTADEFESLADVFRYHLTTEDFKCLQEEFAKQLNENESRRKESLPPGRDQF